MKKEVKRFITEETGIGTVEVILILVVIYTIKLSMYIVYCVGLCNTFFTAYTPVEKDVYIVKPLFFFKDRRL